MTVSTVEDLDKVECEPHNRASFMLRFYFHSEEIYVEMELTRTELKMVETAINEKLHPPVGIYDRRP